MNADTQVENTGAQAAAQRPRQADEYIWKLRATCAFLVFWVIVCVGGLGTLLYYRQIFSTDQPWALSALVAGLGGLIGGVARALYFFSFDSYAFNHKLRTGKSSQWALAIDSKLDDEFDPLWVWYLWCLKPAVGATVGLVLALAIQLGLVSLGAGEDGRVDTNLRLLLLGGIGGFFCENVFERMRSTLGRGGAKS